MAVEDKYIDSDLASNKIGAGHLVNGSELIVVPVTFEVAAADDDGSIYRVLKNINPDLIPVKIEVYNDAITGGTDYDIGIYEPTDRGGAVLNVNVFMNAQSMASARTLDGAAEFGLGNVNVADIQKRIYEHAGHTLSTRIDGYDIAFTAATVGTAAGTITAVFYFAQG